MGSADGGDRSGLHPLRGTSAGRDRCAVWRPVLYGRRATRVSSTAGEGTVAWLPHEWDVPDLVGHRRGDRRPGRKCASVRLFTRDTPSRRASLRLSIEQGSYRWIARGCAYFLRPDSCRGRFRLGGFRMQHARAARHKTRRRPEPRADRSVHPAEGVARGGKDLHVVPGDQAAEAESGVSARSGVQAGLSAA